MLVAIHQPNFFPWLGYFDKIARSDVFIFLDHVQYQKTGGMWSNRVKLLVSGEPRWLSAPLDRSFSGVRPVNEIEFLAGNPWREKFMKTLVASYARTPFFQETRNFFEPLVMSPNQHVATYNAAAVIALCTKLGLSTSKFRWSSKTSFAGEATPMLISLIKSVGGTAYLCGGGASGYQEDQQFTDSGVQLVYQNFVHPQYPQLPGKPFQPGLSIIDALMCCGFDAVSADIRARANER